jgi:hypothetical protein
LVTIFGEMIMSEINKENAKKFFELIDANGVGHDWHLISIENVRVYFEECFNVIPPPFPQISEDQANARACVDRGGGCTCD